MSWICWSGQWQQRCKPARGQGKSGFASTVIILGKVLSRFSKGQERRKTLKKLLRMPMSRLRPNSHPDSPELNQVISFAYNPIEQPKRMKYIFAISSLAAILFSAACSQSPEKLLATANKYHDAKRYKEASILYQKVIS